MVLLPVSLERCEGITSFTKGMFRNFTSPQTLNVLGFRKLMELPNEPFNLALEHLNIHICHKLEYLPEKTWEHY